MHWTEPATADLKPSEYSPTVLGQIFLKGAQASRLFLPEQTAKIAIPLSYTPTSIVRLIVEILESYHGRILDPACGSGGMFIQSARFVEAPHFDSWITRLEQFAAS